MFPKEKLINGISLQLIIGVSHKRNVSLWGNTALVHIKRPCTPVSDTFENVKCRQATLEGEWGRRGMIMSCATIKV